MPTDSAAPGGAAPGGAARQGTRRGIWCQLGDPVATGIAARSGADWIGLDAQHGLFDRAAVMASLSASRNDWPPVAVRLSRLDAAEIGFALDAGADWVIVPLVETLEQAHEAVDASYFPPLGRRSWGPFTPLWARPTPDAAGANARPRLWIMIETVAGVEAVERLAAVEGVGGLFVGPNDLSLSLGIAQDELIADRSPDGPLQRVLAAARAAGIAAGAFAGDAGKSAGMIAQGFDWVAVGTDTAGLADGIRAMLASSGA